MKILIDGKEAAFMEDFSFDYVAENRLFMGRDAYTFDMTFPLKDCPQNLAIFGLLYRPDVPCEGMTFDCEIRDKNNVYYGILLVIGRTDSDLKCQFAEGRCKETVVDPFENTYINKLDLGAPQYTRASEISPVNAWRGLFFGNSAVALPWINEAYPTVPNNWVDYKNGSYSWHKDVEYLSWQPYLIVIASKICQEIGYSYDFQKWYESGYSQLIICNVLPGSWERPGYADALPAWTVSEFFEKLELLLMCEFDFDHKAKTVSMRFSKDVIENTPVVCLDDVVDDFDASIETSDDTSCDYIGCKRIAYKQTGHPMENYYMCDWYTASMNLPLDYSSVNEMLETNGPRDAGYGPVYGRTITGMNAAYGIFNNTLHYPWRVKAVNTVFCTRSIGTEKHSFASGVWGVKGDRYCQIRVCTPVNVFGAGIPESDDVETEEIDFVPVCITDTYISKSDDMGFMMMMSFDSEDESEEAAQIDELTGFYALEDVVIQKRPARIIEKGNPSVADAFYDTVFVAFWDGMVPEPGKQPYPFLDKVTITQDWKYIRKNYSLRLYSDDRNTVRNIPMIDKKQKFKYSFLADKIPNPRAIFNIHGRLFVCEKITATFSQNGMSQMLKGEFYPLLE